MQANKAGLMEIADVFVINKADRPGVDDTRRDLEQMLDLSEVVTWRPPIVATDAVEGDGVDELVDAVQQHRAHLESSGELTTRRDKRLRDELALIVTQRLRRRADSLLGGRRARRDRGRGGGAPPRPVDRRRPGAGRAARVVTAPPKAVPLGRRVGSVDV